MSFPRYPSYKDSGVEWLGVAGCGRHFFNARHRCALHIMGSSKPLDHSTWRLQAATPSGLPFALVEGGAA